MSADLGIALLAALAVVTMAIAAACVPDRWNEPPSLNHHTPFRRRPR